MDDLDRASALEIKHTQMALSSHLKANQSKLVVSAVNCVECGDLIPEARRLVVQGCQHCIYCQSLAE